MMNKATHDCVFDSSMLNGAIVPTHIECSKAEEEGVTIYTVYWNTRLTCVIQQGGPVTIMDYHYPNDEAVMFSTLAEAMPKLLAKLSRIK